MTFLGKFLIAIILIMSLALASCSQFTPTTIPSTPTTLANTKTAFGFNTDLVAKSVIVPPLPKADLAYSIYGRVESVEVQIGDTVHTGDTLIQLEKVVLEAELARAESVLKGTKIDYEYRKKLVEAPIQISDIPKLKNDVEVADVNITKAEADLVMAQNNLKLATLTAPFDGTILDVLVVPGETAYSGMVAVTMIDLQNLQVETIDLSENDISRIYVGQPVSVYIFALDINIEGEVIRIAPQALMLGETRVFKVTIQLNEQPENLMWGMSAEAKFATDK